MDTTPDASKTNMESGSLISSLLRILSAPSSSREKSSEVEGSPQLHDSESKLIASFEQEVEQFNWDTTENPDDTFSPLYRNIESGSTPVLNVETENHSSSSFDDTTREIEMKDNRKVGGEVLARAADVITTQRGTQHGDAETSFQMIADFWNLFISHKEFRRKGIVVRADITAADVAEMMSLFKKARKVYGSDTSLDNFVDDAGYTGLHAMLCGVVIPEPDAKEAPTTYDPRAPLELSEEAKRQMAETPTADGRMVGGDRNG